MKKNSKEIWVSVPGYEGHYEVSNQGNVKSLDRTVINSMGRKRFYKGKILKKTLNNTGYQQVGLSKDDKKTFINIHQLVAIAFLGHTPNGNSLVIDHINGVKTDNRVENLQIVTHRNNTSTCYRANEDLFSSKYVGVSWDKVTNKWFSQISIQGKRKHLGRYNTELEASNKYQEVLSEINDGTFNPENYKPKFTSKYKGVSFNKTNKKWRADIVFHNKQILLGRFENEIDASNSYQKALGEINDGTFDPEYYKPSFTSNFKGITFHKASQKWLCQPTINGKQVYLGIYPTEEEAYQTILLFESAQPIVNNS